MKYEVKPEKFPKLFVILSYINEETFRNAQSGDFQFYGLIGNIVEMLSQNLPNFNEVINDIMDYDLVKQKRVYFKIFGRYYS